MKRIRISPLLFVGAMALIMWLESVRTWDLREHCGIGSSPFCLVELWIKAVILTFVER